jgi:hypothetical protein
LTSRAGTALWATTQNNLSDAASGLGEREGGTARLEAAVETNWEGLEELTRSRVHRQSRSRRKFDLID